MGLSILDRKCKTISISGVKTETVGFVKTTVQCLTNGVQSGTTYIKAKVVRDFYKYFGSDGMCSEKLQSNMSPTKTSDVDMSNDTDNTELQDAKLH